jgi:Domain of unknown function (DUF4349)
MRGRWYLAGGVLAVLVVGACSASGGGGSAADVAGVRGPAHAQGGQAGAGGLAAGVPSSVRGAPIPVGGTIGGTGNTSGRELTKTIPFVDGGYKIRTARMTVAIKGAKNVSNAAQQADNYALAAGGEVDEDNRTSGPSASAELLLRVPPEALADTLDKLSRLGKELSRSLSTTDVTQRVADVGSRVASARQSIDRLRILFRHATKIGAIIQLESELNQREADLESLEAQQRALARETSMATISLDLQTAARVIAPPKPVHKKHENGFVTALKRGWHGFTAAAAWIARAFATLLPFLVLLLLIGFGLRVVWPRLPHRTRAAPAPTPSE